jgi:hypothetical protein
MDAETAARFAAQEARISDLARQLDAVLNPPPQGKVLCMKEAAARLGVSRHTMRRRALADPSLGHKRGGVWEIDAERLTLHLKR